MTRQTTKDPEPLAQIVFVEFDATDPEDRDIYISFKGFTAGYSATLRTKAELKGIDTEKELSPEEKKELTEELHYYIKNPDGKLLRFEFEYYGGLKEIEPKNDPNAEKLDWIKYDKQKFIEKDGAEQVMSFLLFKDKGVYRIRKTVLTQDLEGDVSIEKTATRKDRELFDNAFKYQIEHLYNILHIHDIFSQAGGVAIFKNLESGGYTRIGQVEKDILVKAGIKDAHSEGEFMKTYLDNYAKENRLERKELFYLPSNTQLIPEAFLEKLMIDKVKKDANGNVYPYRTLEVKPENYAGALSDAEIALNYAFGNLLKESNKPLKDITFQGKTAKFDRFDQFLNNTVQQPFLQRYDPDKTKYQQLEPVKISRRSEKNTVLNYVYLQTDVELDYFDQLVLSAYKTWKKLYPNEAPTFLDIANILHHPKSKKSLLSSRSKIIQDIAMSFDSLRLTLCKIDFKGQANTYKNNKNFQRYLNNGGSGIISFPFISAIRKPIRTANGEVLDGIVPDGKESDKLLDMYITMTGQVRTVTGEALINPLRATREDLKIFHYMLSRVCSMPYFHNTISLFSEKQRYLSLTAGIEPEPVKDNSELNSIWKKEPEPEPEPLPDNAEALAGKMLELEAQAQKKDLTISLDTLIENLKLISPKDKPAQIKKRRNTVKTKIEKILEYWKSTGLISGYTVNKKRNGRGVQSYTLSFFSDTDK